ncbi:MAG: 23S rRNA (adenine(2503)-C(2))-methyltransferase RlmN [Lachnospiraceae bacterium]|nr:23S rRNA (adenine(2503)-C(2))-methyltransferase RlmN [Lachnospiraceae bacterium]
MTENHDENVKNGSPGILSPDLRSMTLPELQAFLQELGEPKFRAGQLFSWLHEKCARTPEEMTNLPASLRQRVADGIFAAETVQVQVSAEDGTRKYLFRMPDGELVESVLLRYHHGNTVCVSSQVGCRMGCSFCASTLKGLSRSLRPSEILEQIYAITRDTGERISNVVVMGMGEPLDNYENVLRFIELLTCEGGLHISQRNVTVSTCGLVPEIRKLAGEHLQITLAISLHAATDAQRQAIMPIAKRYALKELMEACAIYVEETGRRVTFEYSLIRGVNDTEEDAQNLSKLAKPLGAHVNLIPVNPVRETGMQPTERGQVLAFQKKLESRGVNATIRRELGRDIDGACGQLRNRNLTDETAL